MLSLLVFLPACAPPAPTTLPDGPLPLEPAAGDVAAYIVERADTDVVCPDGTAARLWVARPDPLPATAPIAVVFHPGAFDWVADPPTGEPLAGDHFADPTRLHRDFGSREAFAVLGMWTSAEELIDAQGALTVALADAGAAIVVPENCFGDLWHNEVADAPTGRENAVIDDGFARHGYAIARAAWGAAATPGVASDLGLTLPPAGTTEVWLVGQSTGGRAVSELLHDGATPDAVGLDATPDDLSAILSADQRVWGGWTDGLARLFPEGPDSMDDGALFTAPLPARVAFFWSSRDPAFPIESYDPAIARLSTTLGATVRDTEVDTHVATATDPDLAHDLVGLLMPPAPGPARPGRVRR